MQGFGQALNNARTIADCCNHDTMLIPELVVVSPLKRATMAALLSLPRHSPLSVRNTKWICHPGLIEKSSSNNPADQVSPVQDLSLCFPGIDYSLLLGYEAQKAGKINETDMSEEESKRDLLARADNFLTWLQKRDERVIVGKHATSFLFPVRFLFILSKISCILLTCFCIHFSCKSLLLAAGILRIFHAVRTT